MTTFREYVLSLPFTDGPAGDFVLDMRRATNFPDVKTWDEMWDAICGYRCGERLDIPYYATSREILIFTTRGRYEFDELDNIIDNAWAEYSA